MEKKTIATTISLILTLFFVAIIGSTLSTYVVMKKKIEVEEIVLSIGEGIFVADKKGKQISKLEIKSKEIGMRPVTGEQNEKTNIPSTINDTISTEGAYAKFFLTTLSAYEIRLKSVWVSNGYDENKDNIFIGFHDDNSESVSIDKVGAVISRGERVTHREMIVVIWLDPDVTKSLIGADIIVELEIVHV